MRYRTYKNSDLSVSEVGFGLWTISTGWWGNFTEGEAIALMHRAFDLGITLFDATPNLHGMCQRRRARIRIHG
jgi:aryl-alcohol dehydrogenase-like predicted oxidoreductase